MIAEPYIPWEDRPACWSWDPPLLPQPNRRGRLEAWQDIRDLATACGYEAFFDDHDHDTGDTRGYLCPSCNGLEGISPRPIYENYRRRPPVAIVGVQLRYKMDGHPVAKAAERAWELALTLLNDRARQIVDAMYADLLDLEYPSLGAGQIEKRLTPMTPLMRSALAVGLTQEEWNATRELIREWEWDRSHGYPPRTLEESNRRRMDDPACQVKLLHWALDWPDSDHDRIELQQMHLRFVHATSDIESAIHELRRRPANVPDAIAAGGLMTQALQYARDATELLRHAVEQYDADRVDRSPAHVLAEVLE